MKPTIKIVILSATRTPIGAFRRALAGVPASQLGATAIHSALSGARIAAGDVGIVVAGGMENMSAAPYPLDQSRAGY
jgi:acetyl-CoA C-acetyltransferase